MEWETKRKTVVSDSKMECVTKAKTVRSDTKMGCETKAETVASDSKMDCESISEAAASNAKMEREAKSGMVTEKAPTERLCNYYRKATRTTVEKFLSSFSFNMYKVFYPEIYASKPFQLKDLHHQLINQLQSSIPEDLNEICKEKKVLRTLQSLDGVINHYKGKERENAWRPSGIPAEDTRDHMYQLKSRHKEKLQGILDALKAKNDSAKATMNENSKFITTLKKDMDDCNSKMDNLLENVADVEVKFLEEELHELIELV